MKSLTYRAFGRGGVGVGRIIPLVIVDSRSSTIYIDVCGWEQISNIVKVLVRSFMHHIPLELQVSNGFRRPESDIDRCPITTIQIGCTSDVQRRASDFRAGAPWRLRAYDFPEWAAVYQQNERCSHTECCTAIVNDLGSILHDAHPIPAALLLMHAHCNRAAKVGCVLAMIGTKATRQ